MKVFVGKHICSNAFVVQGQRVPFEQIGDNQGVLMLDDADPNHKTLIEALTKAAAEHRGGIEIIDERTYLEKKKGTLVSNYDLALKRQKQMLTVAPSVIPQKSKPAVVASPAAPAGKDAEGVPWDAAPRNGEGLRLDGPTRQEFVDAGYDLKNYPPKGYAERTTPAANDPLVKKFKPRTSKLPPKESKLDIP